MRIIRTVAVLLVSFVFLPVHAQFGPLTNIPLPYPIGNTNEAAIGAGYVLAAYSCTTTAPMYSGLCATISYDDGRTWTDVPSRYQNSRRWVAFGDSAIMGYTGTSMVFIDPFTFELLAELDSTMLTSSSGRDGYTLKVGHYAYVPYYEYEDRIQSQRTTRLYEVDLHARTVTLIPMVDEQDFYGGVLDVMSNGRTLFAYKGGRWNVTSDFVNFTPIHLPVESGVRFFADDKDTVVYAITNDDSTYASTDWGVTWTYRGAYRSSAYRDAGGRELALTTLPYPQGVVCSVVSGSDTTKLWTLSKVQALGITYCDGKGRWVVGSELGLVVSNDDGATWTPCTEPAQYTYPANGISVLPDGRVHLSYGGSSNTFLSADPALFSWDRVEVDGLMTTGQPLWCTQVQGRIVGIGTLGTLFSEQDGVLRARPYAEYLQADGIKLTPWHVSHVGDSLLLSSPYSSTLWSWGDAMWPQPVVTDPSSPSSRFPCTSVCYRRRDGRLDLGGTAASRMEMLPDGSLHDTVLDADAHCSVNFPAAVVAIDVADTISTDYMMIVGLTRPNMVLNDMFEITDCFALYRSSVFTNGGWPGMRDEYIDTLQRNWGDGSRAPGGHVRWVVKIDDTTHMLVPLESDGTITYVGMLRNRLDSAQWYPVAGIEGQVRNVLYDAPRSRFVILTDQALYTASWRTTSVHEPVADVIDIPAVFDHVLICDVQGRVLSARGELPAWDSLPAGTYGIVYMNEGRTAGRTWVVTDGIRITGQSR